MKTYRITIKGRDYEVTVGDLRSSPVHVTVDGVDYQVGIPARPAASPASSRPTSAEPLPRAVTPPSGPRPSVPASGSDGSIRALMPGRIITVNVSVGQNVKAGQAVLVMESMKMENTISAVKDGAVRAILVAEGDTVQHGQTMIEIDS